MMNKLVISLATRNRPKQVVDTINRTLPHIALPNTVLMVQVDDDDQNTIDALKCSDPRVQINIKSREDTNAEKWERALVEPADVYLIAADEHPHITPGFDAKILEAAARFPDGIGWVYGHCANASFPAVMGVTAKFVENIGFIFPKYFPYWFVDHWTDDVARMVGRISYADVWTDQTGAGGKTQELREPGWWATFFDAAYLMRRKQAHDIINSSDFQSPDWLKEILLRHHPMIEYRTRWINDSVRQMSRQLEGMHKYDLREPRYLRKKAEALAILPSFLNDYGMDEQERKMFSVALEQPTNIVNLKQSFA